MSQELAGSTALVTGATAGIGRATALRLAALGADVVVHGRDAARGAEVLDTIIASGGTGRFIAADLQDPAEVRRLASEAGDVDVLVNNAGIYHFAGTTELGVESFDAQFAVNTRAPFLLVAALAPGMVERGRGSIVNVSTVAASSPVGGGGAYGASKAAIELLTLTWAAEFGGAGVRVNAVSPGPVHTLGTSGMAEGINAIGRGTASGRPGQADEIAETIAFLATDRASYVNGSILGVHGGAQALGV